jgi:hypothetical protein
MRSAKPGPGPGYEDARQRGGTQEEASISARRYIEEGGTMFPDDVERLEAFSDLMTGWIRRYAIRSTRPSHRRAAADIYLFDDSPS